LSTQQDQFAWLDLLAVKLYSKPNKHTYVVSINVPVIVS